MIATLLRELEKRYIWERDYANAPLLLRGVIYAARLLILLVRDLVEGDMSMRAMSLVYTTLLSFVPLLALSFSILKGFGVQNRLDETLRTALAPLGDEKALQLSENIIHFVNNMNVGVLGAVGLVFLIYTVVSLMQKIENSFNHVWRIDVQRSFGNRFSTFLSVITIGPLLIFSAIAITGSAMNTSLMSYLQSTAVIGTAIELIARLIPFALVIAAFTFLYGLIPNTRVHLSAALTGGIVAGILWETLSFTFASFAAGASRYQAIYATFASAILFMIWLYLNWLILLVGASIAFYRQHPEVVATGLRAVYFSRALTQDYALSLLARIGQRHYDNEPAYTLAALADEYQVPSHALEYVLTKLVEIGVLVVTDTEEARYLPNVPFEATSVAHVLDLLDHHQPPGTYSPPPVTEAQVEAMNQIISSARQQSLHDITLKSLAWPDADSLQPAKRSAALP